MPWVTKNSAEQYPQQKPEGDAYAQYHRSYTKKEKAANWWHYHGWMVVAGIAAVVLLVWVVRDTVFRVRPDIKVGYVGEQNLPIDTAAALTAALESFCTDLNGDGKVVVQLNQYTVDFDSADDSTDAYNQMAGVTQLSAELSPGGSTYVFLLADPLGFERETQILQYLDGTVALDPETTDPADWPQMVYRWTDCPVLTALDLGQYSGETLLDDKTGANQSVLSGLYLGRRGVWDEKQADDFAGGPELWAALTAGAVSTAGEGAQ